MLFNKLLLIGLYYRIIKSIKKENDCTAINNCYYACHISVKKYLNILWAILYPMKTYGMFDEAIQNGLLFIMNK